MTKYLSGLLLTSFLNAASPVHAQLPQRVSDLNPMGGDAMPRHLTSFNNKLYFSADNGSTGRELWSYDGSICLPAAPGCRVDDFGVLSVSMSDFPVLSGKMYLLGNLPATPGNTRLLSYDGINPPDRAPGISDSVLFDQTDFITFRNRIFFSAGTTATGSELYAYDGVSAPTVYDINPISASSPHAFTAFNGKLYFLATGNNAMQGEELHMYDPTTEQCSLIADIHQGPLGSFCRGFTVAGNKIYFAAMLAGTGLELWETDGITTKRLSDLAPGVNHGVDLTSAYYKGNIIFPGSANGIDFFPYKYDVSTGQISRMSNDDDIKGPGWSAEYKGNLYFTCTKGSPANLGSELWKYDGTNITMMPEIWPGQSGSDPHNYFVHNGYLYFAARDSAYGIELYRLLDPTSILNTSFEGELKLFPNPAKTYATLRLTLKSTQQLSLSLADMTGKEVYLMGIHAFGSGRNEITIPLQSFACGSYSYQLMNSAGQRMAGGILIKE